MHRKFSRFANFPWNVLCIPHGLPHSIFLAFSDIFHFPTFFGNFAKSPVHKAVGIFESWLHRFPSIWMHVKQSNLGEAVCLAYNIWTTFCNWEPKLAQFRNNICTINFPTFISVCTNEPEIVLPIYEIKTNFIIAFLIKSSCFQAPTLDLFSFISKYSKAVEVKFTPGTCNFATEWRHGSFGWCARDISRSVKPWGMGQVHLAIVSRWRGLIFTRAGQHYPIAWGRGYFQRDLNRAREIAPEVGQCAGFQRRSPAEKRAVLSPRRVGHPRAYE